MEVRMGKESDFDWNPRMEQQNQQISRFCVLKGTLCLYLHFFFLADTLWDGRVLFDYCRYGMNFKDSSIFWAITPCRPINVNGRFVAYCRNFQGV
jgi:hypothetical protein